MTKRFRLALALPLAALPAAALAATPPAPPQRDPELVRFLADKVPGTPRDCLSPLERQSSRSFRGAMTFESGGSIYLNEFNGDCPDLTRFSYPVFTTPTGQLCRGDIAQIRETGINFPGGSCILGPFVPYTRVKGAQPR